jgi:cytochrome c5
MKRLVILACLAGFLLLIVYGAITMYDETFRYGRMWETPAVRPYEEPLPIMEKGLVPTTGGELFLRGIEEREFEKLSTNGFPESLLLGEKKYGMYCSHCHGKKLDGRGTVGQSFSPVATDLKELRIQKQSNKEIFHTVSYGKLRMPPLAQTIAADDRRAIIMYLRSRASESK